jgi:large subunit ribosomal protein L30
MAKVKVTQVKSTASATERQQANMRALGIHRIRQSVEVELTPVTAGMIEKVRHLVKVEEVK